ncbi:MAG TPA: DUF5666 domain-containing protein, partial [Rhodocyclaceae bacterium]|nr:DUF5666 domain-containing protein [Rhodocyclaceae bacterium]
MRLLRPLAFATLLALCSLGRAAPVCIDPEIPELPSHGSDAGGIGGTGAPSSGGGTGGTGDPAAGGGIGGTGTPARGGIGGTGAPLANGETIGIFGTITGFASVCINGLEVHFDDHVKVTENGDPAAPAQLAVGQVISVEAVGTPRGPVARNIAIVHALAGPITHVSGNGKTITVMGQPVHLSAATRIVGQPGSFAVGQRVKVSGLRDGAGNVVGTRIQAAPDLVQAAVSGHVVRDAKGAAVGQIPVAGGLANGDVIAKGHWTGHELSAQTVIADPSFRFSESTRRVVVEGIVATRPDGQSISASGINARIGPRTRVEGDRQLIDNVRVRIDGRLTGYRRIEADRIDILGPAGGNSGEPSRQTG